MQSFGKVGVTIAKYSGLCFSWWKDCSLFFDTVAIPLARYSLYITSQAEHVNVKDLSSINSYRE